MSLTKISSLKFVTSNAQLHATQRHTREKFIRCKANVVIACAQAIPRRVANYNPTIWEDDYVQSLSNNSVGDVYSKRYDELKEEVRRSIGTLKDEVVIFELIDTLSRLGISYLFQHEIRNTLDNIYDTRYGDESLKNNENDNLFAVALEFRILRQNGYNVPQEIFNKFKDINGEFKSSICEDIKGILYFYEASFLSTIGESILDEARDFTAKILQEYLKNKRIRINGDVNDLDILVEHALELPLHWRMLRLEARWFIDVYERRQDADPTLLKLAKMDFNMVQTSHKEELKQMSRWWKSTYLGEKLSFARDRLMQQYFWTSGVLFEPQYGYGRKMSTKINSLVTIIDDIYDVYGSLEELQLFTTAVKSWNISAMEKLPDYMKICFLALYNSTNEMAYNTLVHKGVFVISYFAKAWADLCESFMVEARWYYSGYTPTLEEYIENAWISISSPLVLVVAYLFVADNFTTKTMECLEEYPNLIRYSSTILRLSNDLGTSTQELERGDNPKSIQCYMHEKGVTEIEAREHIKYLISELWKKLNDEMYRYHHNRRQSQDSPFEELLIGIAMNAARMAQCVYQHGDGHGIEDKESKAMVLALLIHPIN